MLIFGGLQAKIECFRIILKFWAFNPLRKKIFSKCRKATIPDFKKYFCMQKIRSIGRKLNVLWYFCNLRFFQCKNWAFRPFLPYLQWWKNKPATLKLLFAHIEFIFCSNKCDGKTILNSMWISLKRKFKLFVFLDFSYFFHWFHLLQKNGKWICMNDENLV